MMKALKWLAGLFWKTEEDATAAQWAGWRCYSDQLVAELAA